jgi:four helix bundle protein
MSKGFEDLEVWKKSCDLVIEIYELLKDCKDYSIKDQIIRASLSIPSNISEGSVRNSVTDFKRFLSKNQYNKRNRFC